MAQSSSPSGQSSPASGRSGSRRRSAGGKPRALARAIRAWALLWWRKSLPLLPPRSAAAPGLRAGSRAGSGRLGRRRPRRRGRARGLRCPGPSARRPGPRAARPPARRRPRPPGGRSGPPGPPARPGRGSAGGRRASRVAARARPTAAGGATGPARSRPAPGRGRSGLPAAGAGPARRPVTAGPPVRRRSPLEPLDRFAQSARAAAGSDPARAWAATAGNRASTIGSRSSAARALAAGRSFAAIRRQTARRPRPCAVLRSGRGPGGPRPGRSPRFAPRSRPGSCRAGSAALVAALQELQRPREIDPRQGQRHVVAGVGEGFAAGLRGQGCRLQGERRAAVGVAEVEPAVGNPGEQAGRLAGLLDLAVPAARRVRAGRGGTRSGPYPPGGRTGPGL